MRGLRRNTTIHRRLFTAWAAISMVLFLMICASPASAITPIPDPAPSADSYGIEAEKPQPPPTTTAAISTPNNGSSASSSPVTVSGLCTTGLLVQLYDNGVLAGSVMCTSGSFSLQVTLYTGQNDIYTIQYDNLSQASPQGNTITLNYNNASFSAFGTLVTLTSNYGRREANPGDTLTWPLQLSGGNGPYAFSIDWGDGSSPELLSQDQAGLVNISHVYGKSGVYKVVVRVADTNGVTAYLQLVAVADGQPASTGAGSGSSTKSTPTAQQTKVLWTPAAVAIFLLIPTYWLGRRSELVSLHRKLEKDMAKYKEY